MSEQDLISADLRTHTDPELDEKVEALQLCLRSAKAKLDAYERQWNDLLAVSRQADKLNREMYPEFREQKDE